MDKIILIAGGNSVEHEISLLTLKQVYNAIDKNKYEVNVVYISKDNLFYLVKDINKNKSLEDYHKIPLTLFKEKNKQYFKYKRKKIYFDYLFLLGHGKGIEDGTLNGYLDFLDIPYISHSLISSALGMDKYLTKKVVENFKINTLDSKIINLNDYDYDKLMTELKDYPYIIKANSLGSSIGVFKANKSSEVKEYLDSISIYDDYAVIEKCLENFKEYNIALYKYDNEFVISSIEEINYKKVLTYDDKYSNNGLENLKREINPNIPLKLKNKIINYSKKIYDLLKCEFIVRIDYLYDIDKEELYFNEINLIPGSLAFYLFEDKNILFDELLDNLIKLGKRNRYLKINKVNILGDNIFEGLINNIKK